METKNLGIVPAILTMLAIIFIAMGVSDWTTLAEGLLRWTVWMYFIIGLVLLIISQSFDWKY